MKIVPIVSDDPKVARAVSILDGMTQSACNAVIFRDEPEVWFQFYLGLYLELPTFVIMQQKDLTPEIQWNLSRMKVHLTMVDEFNDEALKKFTKNIETWVNK